MMAYSSEMWCVTLSHLHDSDSNSLEFDGFGLHPVHTQTTVAMASASNQRKRVVRLMCALMPSYAVA